MKDTREITSITIMAILILSAVFAAACSLSIPWKGNKGSESIHTGKQGLAVQFLPNAPPSNIFAEDFFQIGLRVTNKGVANITNGVLAINVDDALMRIAGWESYNDYLFSLGGGAGQLVNFKFPGKNVLYPDGIDELLYMNLQAKGIDPRINDVKTQVIITSCYDYKTEFIESVCIEAGKFMPNAPTACTASPISSSSGQGAPVVITRVEVDTLTSGSDYARPQFTIYIENAGNGRVISDKGMREACSSGAIGKEESNILKVEEIQFSDFRFTSNDIKCNPLTEDYMVRLKHDPLTTDKAILRCTLEPNRLRADAGNYETPLYMRLSYGYTESVTKEVVIEQP